ncbi:unnamed protein product [Somion occarium]|uniref:RAM signaling network component n=1 Tax=Somion occarium TaxID=3059160 RepID=A0ABP1DB05_9APHY
MTSTDAESVTGRILAATNGVLSPGPLPSVSLSRDHITEALAKSPDTGATLDLTRKNLTDVGEDGAEELATVVRETDEEPDSTVARITLAHNRLTTLPMAFALLSRLRYLVLKNNNFTVFPDVLTIMPSLEILDISRNKIKRLPSQPGSLINLRIFSITRNGIHRLPAYFTQFRNLALFRAEQNPIEWPPKSVMEAPSVVEGAAMKGWISNVQKWMEDNGSMERKQSDDSVVTEQSSLDYENDQPLDDFQGNSPFLQERDGSQTNIDSALHIRSFSLESDVSIYSDMANLHAPPKRKASHSPGPSRLRLDVPVIPRSLSANASPVRSPGTYLPTPDESIPSTDDETTNTNRTRRGKLSWHLRASSAFASHDTAKRIGAKSLPELRSPTLPEKYPGLNSQVPLPAGPIPSPPFRQESGSSNGSVSNHTRTRILAQDTVSASPISTDRPAPPMDVERNSYFRRLSTLTSTPLYKSVPASLLKLVDAIRGILFAVSQIYQTLQHYTVYAIDERLSAVLLKVLDPASMYMHQLIDALDRFDTTCRRTLPSPALCRAVVESCRDNVTVFGKAIGMLSLQLKVLATHDDVRYTRQMLLVLYGAMAEIASSWQTITSEIEVVKPLLQDHRPPPVSKSYVAPTPTIRTTTVSPVENVLSPPATAPAALSMPSGSHGLQFRPLLRSNSGHDTGDLEKRISRRHAGSFSLKDVQIGRMLPSFVGAPHLSAGVAETSSTPTLRASRRMPQSAGSTPVTHFVGPVPSSILPARWDSHSREGSSSSLVASMSSPSLKPPMADQASSTNTLMDKQAIEAVKVAVEAAPSVWEMMDGLLGEIEELREELSESLQKAKEITEVVRINIQALEAGDPSADRNHLREDAHVFVRTVIHLSNAVKTHGTAQHLPDELRMNMVTLTNATQEFVILLHVSSFSPAPTPRPYSHMVSAVSVPRSTPPVIPEDGQLGANLSRSRSTAPTSSKLVRPHREPPRSALLSHQSFRIPTPPRFGLLRSRSGEEAVPG